MNEEAQYKYEGQNMYSYEGSYSVFNWPTPVGYWILDPGACCTKFAQYKKHTRLRIWFTEKLLGWKWEDAK